MDAVPNSGALLMRRTRRRILIGVALMVWLLPGAVSACPGCKEALFDPGQVQQQRSMAKGYALSIGLLLIMPLGLVGGGTVYLIRSHRRRQRENVPGP